LKKGDIPKNLLKRREEMDVMVEDAMNDFKEEPDVSRSALEEILAKSYLLRRDEMARFVERPDKDCFRGKTFFSKYHAFKDKKLVLTRTYVSLTHSTFSQLIFFYNH
jgi:hypothetical protein